MTKNVLFIMCDQLRADYLGCGGHPTIRTPNIDALAARGVQFSQSYVQSPICGPSRMSTYTGRYVRSHGSDYNQVPLRVGEWTLGDHLNKFGARAVLCGKTHMRADVDGMARLGIDPDSPKGRHIAECGFDVWDRLDGLHPTGGRAPSHYNDYLRRHGFDGENPWEEWAASVVDIDGKVKNGWLNENAHLPARIPEEHSETAYSTTRAIEFMQQADGDPWCLHLSYIKPHWPMAAPAPYHDMYGPDDIVAPVRAGHEKTDAHPVYRHNQDVRHSQIYNRDGAREKVIASYMGLITQIDDHIGRLITFMEDTGRMMDTMIVFTSDHGDYLGDHWMGEKLYFHDQSVRVPMIIYDPSPQADATRGTTDPRLSEAIDLAPTIVDFMGGDVQSHILEGRSLLPLIRGEETDWRTCAFSQADFSHISTRAALGHPAEDCGMVMAFDGRWKYVYAKGLPAMLFDLETDPQEFNDLGGDPAFADECGRMQAHVLDWALGGKTRVTQTQAEIENAKPASASGILIGFWDEAEHRAAQARNNS
ncbi:sulfatase-like hydrolase/transferase [Octadecabacter sp. G9-8]|uniref:Sulfatase-like hydrolase/transferase n=1 Tax=Octadecabacter dasysiphoniae TaxID=2909341 RepID=A0ABS9CVC3_9RHOB|nr:sulfatase-like hydrolase/transferase [Octadecabacter dasysiphoniae]MCF2870360.1 sulfatase-like hydrolase/transferase [Octadecabacter dasysiphoniae]